MYPLMPCIFYAMNIYHIIIKLSYIKIQRCRGVPWLGFQAVAWVQSLIKGLRSHKPHGTAKKKKKYKQVKNKLEVIREQSTGEKELKVKTDSFPSFFFPLQNMFRIFQFRRSVLQPL